MHRSFNVSVPVAARHRLYAPAIAGLAFSVFFSVFSMLASSAAYAQAPSSEPTSTSSSTGSSSTGSSSTGSSSTGIRITPTVRFLGGLFNVGGYYFTSASATHAIGTPKFSGDSQLFVRPKSFGKVLLTGGLEYVHASDHLLPFQSGNELQLIGPAFRVTTLRHIGQPRPFLTGGLFYGRLRSVNQGFDRSNFVPSINIGVEYPFARYFTVYAGYRVSQQIHSVNTDGVNIGFKVF